jgi:hypothetical protein
MVVALSGHEPFEINRQHDAMHNFPKGAVVDSSSPAQPSRRNTQHDPAPMITVELCPAQQKGSNWPDTFMSQ